MINQLWLRIKLLKDDRVMMGVMTVMALGLAMIFSSSMSGNYRPLVMVVNEDDSVISQEFLTDLESGDMFHFLQGSKEEGIQEVERGRSVALLVIPQGFGDQLVQGENMRVDIFQSRETLEVIQLENQIRSAGFKFVSKWTTASYMAERLQDSIDPLEIDSFKQEIFDRGTHHWRFRNPYQVTSEVIGADSIWAFYNPNLHYLIGFTLFFSTFTITFVGSDILKEKKLKTWQRKLVSPVSNSKIMMSLVLTTFIVGMFQVGLIVLVGRVFMDVHFGMNLGLLLLVFAGFVYTFTSFGLVLGGLAKSLDQLGAFTPVILIAAGMLGGTMWPLEIIQSDILLMASNFMPHKWALQIITQTAAFGLNWQNYFTAIAVLFSMGTVYLIFGIYLSKKNIA